MITKQISPLVKTLDLAPHPEGGWYKELWKASFEIPEGSFRRQILRIPLCSNVDLLLASSR